jgi:hypothetical protein
MPYFTEIWYVLEIKCWSKGRMGKQTRYFPLFVHFVWACFSQSAHKRCTGNLWFVRDHLQSNHDTALYCLEVNLMSDNYVSEANRYSLCKYKWRWRAGLNRDWLTSSDKCKCHPSGAYMPTLCRRTKFVVGVLNRLRAGFPRNRSILGQEFFFFSTAPIPPLRPNQPPTQWVPWGISPGQSSQGVKLTIHLNLVPRLRMYAAILPLPYMSLLPTA